MPRQVREQGQQERRTERDNTVGKEGNSLGRKRQRHDKCGQTANHKHVENVAADDIADCDIRFPFLRRHNGRDKLGKRSTDSNDGKTYKRFTHTELRGNGLRAVYDELSAAAPGEPSAVVRERVNAARAFARDRYKKAQRPIHCNAELSPGDVRTYCTPDEEGDAILRAAYEGLGLSARGHDRILRVARTIADLEGCEKIGALHIAEAIQMRSLDRKYF